MHHVHRILRGIWRVALIPIPDINRWGLYPVALFSLIAVWMWARPMPGWAISILGLGAVIVAVRSTHKMPLWEEICWIVVAFGLCGAEMRTLYKDRTDQEQLSSEARAAQTRNFMEIANGLTEAIRENQQNFNSVMSGTNTLLAENIGGDSFCVMTLEGGALWWKGQGVPMFSHYGQYPLYGISAQVSDNKKLSELMAGVKKGQGLILAATLPAETNLEVGDLPPKTSKIMWDRNLAVHGHEDVSLFIRFVARNGGWDEELRASYDRGQWIQSVFVYRMLKGNQKQKLLKFTTTRLPDAKPD
jgi:hypothetical protein